MCQACPTPAFSTKQRVLSKQDFAPEERRAFEFMLSEYRDTLAPIEDDIEGWLSGADPDDLTNLQTIREQIRTLTDGRVGEFEIVFGEGAQRGAAAGRELAARRSQFDIAFDIVPERTLDVLDDWATEAAGSTLETITEDASRWLRGAHEEGLSIDDIASQLNDDLFDGRLEDYVAERAARTGTISSSNAGAHSAYEDADGVVAEEWLTSLDGRERDDHAEADGQVVAVDTTFEVGGVYLDHPGDPGAPVGQIANCRCAVVPVLADDLTDEQLDAVEAGERIWIR